MTSLLVLRWHEIMACIYLQKPITTNYIRKRVRITYTYMFHVLEELKLKGWVRFEKNKQNNREHFIYLTEPGIKIAAACYEIVTSLKVRQ